MKQPVVNLPVVVSTSDAVSAPVWHDFSPAQPLPGNFETALAAPEPEGPQGDYAASVAIPQISLPVSNPNLPVELLAPAGGPDSAFAALHYGADAIYLGLKKFSARAEAENFTLDELAEVTAYAHSLNPPRRVFVTINTLIRQDELDELVEALAAISDIGVDAVILQDLGVYHVIRRHFPELELHASTQLAVHNRAGAESLKQLGFTRVVLARELTFEEINDITATAGIETEVFIHGALCYSYSGLCLYSSQTLGRSGNRGKCAYSCRDSHDVVGAPDTLRDGSSVKRDPSRGFPFSMKDLALAEFLPSLRAAGVSCFKVEGRKKSPLYVATTTDYYRRLLDGNLDDDDRADREVELKTVFSRPWTQLFLHSHRDKEVADRDTVGHRGALIGQVEQVRDPGTHKSRLRFRTRRSIERHDGLQIDLPVLGKPFGFAVDRLWRIEKRNQSKETFEAPAGAWVEVGLPADHPEIPPGAPVYCSSSQEVKRKYRHQRPKAGQFRPLRQLHIEGILTEPELVVTGRIEPRRAGEASIESRQSLAGPFSAARDSTAMNEAFRTAFARLGETSLTLASWSLANPDRRFVPVSRLNELRRTLTAELERMLDQARTMRVDEIRREICGPVGGGVRRPAPSAAPALGAGLPTPPTPPSTSPFRWSIKVDRIEYVAAFDTTDWDGVEEIIVDIARDHPAMLSEHLDRLGEMLGKERIRLALPPLTRKWEEAGIVHKIDKLRSAGWNKWEASNLSAWTYLAPDAEKFIALPPPHSTPATNSPAQHGSISSLASNTYGNAAAVLSLPPPPDLAADWTLYVLNRLAARQLLDMGVGQFALSPEDGLANMRSLLAEFGPRAVVIVYQDTPLFLAESCAYANLIGGCPGKANCRFESMEMISSHGERVTALDYHCRTIVLNQGPFCLSTRLRDLARAGAQSLRADFVYRKYEPEQVRDIWRLVRAGRAVPGGHAANFDRGVL